MRAKYIVGIIVVTVALAFSVEWIAPALRRPMAIVAAICGLGTWIAPGLAFVLYRRPRTSLGAVGFSIFLFSLAALFSAVGLPLAFAALSLGVGATWAHFALLAISTFWILIVASVAVAGRRSRQIFGRPPGGRAARD